MRRYASKRSYIWSSDIAYSVGLMTSDGCLSKDGRHLDLTSVDIEQLQNFSLAIGRDLTISSKFSRSKTPAYRVQFSDVAYYDFLLKVGLMPAKSATIAELTIPDEYYPDFLRGLFDGDGTCYSYMDKRWKSSYMYYVQLTSASLSFCQHLQFKNTALAKTGAGSLRIGSRSYILSYAKADALKLFNFMYYSPDVICLKRKFIKLRGFTTLTINGIIN